jgi:hypothetical protein
MSKFNSNWFRAVLIFICRKVCCAPFQAPRAPPWGSAPPFENQWLTWFFKFWLAGFYFLEDSWLSWYFFIVRHYFRMCSCVILRSWLLPGLFTGRVVHKKAPENKQIKTVEPDNWPKFSLHSSDYLTGLNTHGILVSLLTSVCYFTLFCLLCRDVGFEVTTTIVMTNSVFWYIRSCSPLKVNQATCFTLGSPLAYSSTLKMKATCSSEASVDFQATTQRYIPEDRTF